MNEALLQTIWKYKLIGQTSFVGSKNERIEIVSIGEHNTDSGPDFFNSKIKINDVLLVGNVEIHIKTSDWLKHSHQNNKAYDNIILHVVYEHDIELEQNQKFNVSVLELKKYISNEQLQVYQHLNSSVQKIPCGKSILSISEFEWKLWLDRLVVGRLELKTEYINNLFKYLNYNYDETLYVLLLRNFGFKINNDAFELLGKSLPYSILKKYSDNVVQTEALLFGVAGLLDELWDDKYLKLLQNEYEFLKHKHQLVNLKKEIWKFSKTRPINFPTIRISQFAHLITKQQSLYHFLETKPSINGIKNYFTINTSDYWKNHFTFQAESEYSEKQLGEQSIELLIINTIVPFLFFISENNEEFKEYAIDLLSSLKPESNSKVLEYKKLGVKVENALESQALIHLHDLFCSKKACLRCHVGSCLLKKQA